MPRPSQGAGKPEMSLSDLFGFAAFELERPIVQPNIISFGEKPYPEQDRFFASNCRGRFISGGNRGGKTDAAVQDAILTATNKHPFRERPIEWGSGPVQLRFLVVDVTKGIEQIMVPKFKRWCLPEQLKGGSWERAWDSSNYILTFANGSTIDFVTWGMDMMKLGGVPRHAIYFDEEPPQNLFNESTVRLIDYRGFWVIAATPTKGIGWTYDLLWEPAQPGGKWHGVIDTFVLSADQNPYLQAEADDMDFYMVGMDEEERKVRESGEFVARSGLVFPMFDLNKHVTHEPFVLPHNWALYSSVDHGLNNPTAWLWHAVGPQGQIITFAEHYQRNMLVSEHAQVVKEREAMWLREPDVRTGDPAMKQRNGVTGTSILQAYGENGIFIGVEGVPHDVMPGIEKMQMYLKPRSDSPWGEGKPSWIISHNCVNFIKEMKKLRWETYDSDKRAYDLNKKETVHKRDDHAFDSARYFATLMPDLRPDPKVGTDGGPKTIEYSELMARMHDDPTVVFPQDVAQDSGWETEYFEAPEVLEEPLV